MNFAFVKSVFFDLLRGLVRRDAPPHLLETCLGPAGSRGPAGQIINAVQASARPPAPILRRATPAGQRQTVVAFHPPQFAGQFLHSLLARRLRAGERLLVCLAERLIVWLPANTSNAPRPATVGSVSSRRTPAAAVRLTRGVTIEHQVAIAVARWPGPRHGLLPAFGIFLRARSTVISMSPLAVRTSYCGVPFAPVAASRLPVSKRRTMPSGV